MAKSKERSRNRLWRKVARALLSAKARRRLYARFDDFMMLFRKDRAYLDRELLPAVGRRGGKALFIGCQRYTRHYPSLLTAHGAECWTIDINSTVARWGAPKRHMIGDIRDGSDHWPPRRSTPLFLMGCSASASTVCEIRTRRCEPAASLKEEGWLILGWNFDRSAEPSELPTLRDHFQPSSFLGLAQRQMFVKSTHVYGTFRRQSIRPLPRADTTALEVSDLSTLIVRWRPPGEQDWRGSRRASVAQRNAPWSESMGETCRNMSTGSFAVAKIWRVSLTWAVRTPPTRSAAATRLTPECQ